MLSSFGLSDPGWPNEEEGTNWPTGLIQANPVPPNCPGDLVNGLVLANYVGFQFLIEVP